MKRLIEKTVFLGLVTACRFATWPTSRSPSFVNATTDGVVRPPSEFAMTAGSPPSRTATTEFVVPRSIPTTLLMRLPPKQQIESALGGGPRVRPDLGPRPNPDNRAAISFCQALKLSMNH